MVIGMLMKRGNKNANWKIYIIALSEQMNRRTEEQKNRGRQE